MAITFVRETNDTLNVGYKYSISIPVCTDARAELLNQAMRNQFIGMKDRFVNFAREQLKDSPPPKGFPSSFEMGVHYHYADSTIVSYLISTWEFTGGAHPNANFTSVNFDLLNRRFISTRDLIPMSDSALYDIVLPALLSELHESCRSSLELTPNNVRSSVSIRKDQVVFTYSPYAILPYACGAPSVKIPKSRLILNLPR